MNALEEGGSNREGKKMGKRKVEEREEKAREEKAKEGQDHKQINGDHTKPS